MKDKIKEQKTGKKSKERKKKQFVFSFNMMDIKTRMYVGCGTSFKSEKDAYNNSIQMIQKTGIKIESLRLDKYYSNQKDVDFVKKYFGDTKMFLIPKESSTIKGSPEWKAMLIRLITNMKGFLKEYFQRNQSESAFAEDKRRIGQRLGQKRIDRIDTANFMTLLWHNLYWLG